MINFSGIDKHQHVTESSHTKIVSNETERGSAEDPLSMQRTESNETAIVSGIPSITNDENVIIAPGQGKKQFQFLQIIYFARSVYEQHHLLSSTLLHTKLNQVHSQN